MNIARMTMPKAQAKRMLRDYRDRIRRVASDEHRAVAEGLRWMARGRAVIHLAEVIRGAGVFENGLPKLAVCRADMRQVECRWNGWATWCAFHALRHTSGGRYPQNMRVQVEMGAEHGKTVWDRRLNGYMRAELRGSTMVPMVPPAALQEAHTGVTALRDFFVLWEVKAWKMVPPCDPLLLKHLGGELYVVVAEWELTEIERAVIAGTRA